VLDIVAEPRRIANRIVEEAMISANICAARVLRDKLGFGVYNVHTGFDPANTEAAGGPAEEPTTCTLIRKKC
jgi:exoribonuclease-2